MEHYSRTIGVGGLPHKDNNYTCVVNPCSRTSNYCILWYVDVVNPCSRCYVIDVCSV